jgi:hypothetical protein
MSPVGSFASWLEPLVEPAAAKPDAELLAHQPRLFAGGRSTASRASGC